MKRFAICAVLMLVTLAVFRQATGFDFIGCDDPDYVIKNELVNGGFTLSGVGDAFTATRCYNWHPLTWVSHMVDWSIHGDNPGGHHITSIVFHIVNTVLLFILLEIMTGCRWRSAVTAALFALHPLHVESVAWVSERKDVLSTFFWFLTTIAYVYYAKRKSAGIYLVVIVLYLLGLMSKPMLVTLPLTLLILDRWPLKREEKPGKLILEKLPLFGAAAVSCVITYIAQDRGGAVQASDTLAFGVRAANAVAASIAYLWKTVWPACLAMPYPHPENTLPMWMVAGSGLLLILISLFAYVNRARRPWVAAGWMWYLMTLIPVIGLVQVGMQAMADRYTYVPLIGIFFAAVWCIPEIAKETRKGKKQQRRIVVPVAIGIAVVVGALAVRAHTQVGVWKDTRSLYENAVRCTKNNYIAYTSLAAAARSEGERYEAVDNYQKAVEIRQDYYPAVLGLGITLVENGQFDSGIQMLKQAVAMEPKDPTARGNLAVAYYLKGDKDAVRREIEYCDYEGIEVDSRLRDMLNAGP